MAGERELKPAGGGKKKTALIVCGAVVGVLAAGYLGLCAWVGASGTAMPNVSIAGLDVSGMTARQIQQAVEEQINSPGTDRADAVELRTDGYTGCLGADCFQVDAAACAQAALDEGRSFFLTNGTQYISHLFHGQRLQARGAAFTADGAAELERLIDEMDTASGALTEQADYRLDVEKETLTFTKGVTHRAIDRESARQTALSAYAGYLDGLNGPDPVSANLLTSEQPPQAPDFDAIHDELYAEAKDARMDPETYEVTEGAVGIDFDVDEARAAFEAAAEGDTFTVPLTVTQPKETRESLEGKLFADLLGEGQTRVTGSSNRRHNVKLSAEACNNFILLPGEEFSYNNTTGSRTEDKGYLPAPIYSGGKSIDDTGGGICQTSSTIYYAVLHTTLEIVERHSHMFNTGYVTMGMDATVFYGSSDFRFKNNTDYPIKIVTEYFAQDGKNYLNVKIYGTNVDGRYGDPASSIYDPVYPTTVYEPKESVARGTLVLDREQYAYTGYTAHTYRTICEADGTVVEKQDLGTSKYKMRPNLYYYNPLDGEPSTWVDGKPPAAPSSGSESGEGAVVPDPGATAPDPGTVTPDPGTTTPDPGTTTPDPGTAAPEPAPDAGDVIPDLPA